MKTSTAIFAALLVFAGNTFTIPAQAQKKQPAQPTQPTTPPATTDSIPPSCPPGVANGCGIYDGL